MAAPLVDRSTGDIIPADDHNDVKSYLEDATYRVNTQSLSVGGASVITASRYVIPARLQSQDGSGIPIFASNGTTQIGLISDDGDLGLKGRVYKI